MARNRFDQDEELEVPFQFNQLKRSLVYVKKQKWYMIGALFLSALGSISLFSVPTLTSKAIDEAMFNKDTKQLVTLSITIAILLILFVLFYCIRGILIAHASQKIIFDIRKDLFYHLQELPFSYYDSRPQGKILVRCVQYINSVSDFLSNGLINLVMEMFNLVVIGYFMFRLDAQLSLLVLAGLPIIITVVMIVKPMQRRRWQAFSNKSSNLSAYSCESIDGVRVSQAFAREDYNANIFSDLATKNRMSWLKAIRTQQIITITAENVSIWVFSLIYVVSLTFLTGEVSVGVIIAMGTYATMFWQPIIALSNVYNSAINTVAYLERIFQTIDEPVDIYDKEGAEQLPEILGAVEFKNVTFEYDKGVTVLNNVSFTVKPGQSIALVGPTGSGKSTIVNLISRFYNITNGEIFIDGHEINDVTIKSLRQQMGIMMQDSFIFTGTLEDNIRYGKLDATHEEILAASKAVWADEFISQMPDGYNTKVEERGGDLSQGQKQLISFARTMLSAPKILVLDEATSSLDAKTERILQKGIQNLLKNRTSFIVAHRLSTIKSCDRIMFIEAGKIVESGTHDELLELKGRYYDYCKKH